MNIIIITQNEPFYLTENIKYLLRRLPKKCSIKGCVVASVSPFGKKENIFKKAIKTFRIFGFRFFLFYFLKFIYSKLFKKSIKQLLKENNIDIIDISGSLNSEKSLEKIKSYNPDLLISILGNQIFKKDLISLPKKGCLNLHTALLPKYRGLMPTFWVLKNNEKYTGVSVFFIDEGIDSGPILVQKKVEIRNMTQYELIKHTKSLGMDAIVEAVSLVMKGDYDLIENPNDKMTYYSFPKRKDVKIFLRNKKRFF